jgi:hypothetical protein
MSDIKYEMLIDGSRAILTFRYEDRDGYHYRTNDAASQVHSFPWPLGKLPIDEHFKHKNHTYVIKTKP